MNREKPTVSNLNICFITPAALFFVNPMNRLIKNTSKHKFLEILTWVGEFRPGNKTIYTVFDEESDVQVKNTHFLRPGGKNKEKRNLKKF